MPRTFQCIGTLFTTHSEPRLLVSHSLFTRYCCSDYPSFPRLGCVCCAMSCLFSLHGLPSEFHTRVKRIGYVQYRGVVYVDGRLQRMRVCLRLATDSSRLCNRQERFFFTHKRAQCRGYCNSIALSCQNKHMPINTYNDFQRPPWCFWGRKDTERKTNQCSPMRLQVAEEKCCTLSVITQH